MRWKDDIIRLPSEASVDNDHEALLHDIMYAKAKESMEWVKFMTRKYDIGMFLVYIIILCLIVSYKYPQNSENLMKMTSDDPFVIENKEFTLADYAYTENKSSFFFLLKDENDNTYIMSATKFPFVDRYELLDCKIFYDKEILEKKDFYNKVVVVNENDKLVLQEKKIFPIQYLCIVLTAVILIIRILAGFIKKR